MKKLKELILELSALTNDVDIENAIQNILEIILRNYHMEFGKAEVFFTDIEMYYRNKGIYDDVTVHGDTKQTHFNEVYVHMHREYKCFDICISLGDYYLSFLVRGAVVNGIPYYEPSKVYDAITAAKSIDGDFDEAKDILRCSPKSKQRNEEFVMYSFRHNLTDANWKERILRAVIEKDLIGKDIYHKEELLKSLVKGMNSGNAKALSKIVLGYMIKDL